MFYLTRTPSPPLDGFIENFWYWEGDKPAHRKDTLMASGRLGLLVNLKEDKLSWYGGEGFAECQTARGIALCGTHSKAFAIDAYQPHVMGVQFRPGGSFPFFRAPSREFQNVQLSLEDIWGPKAQRLHQRLVEAASPKDKFDILERAMLSVVTRDLEHHPAVALALARFARNPSASVAATATQAGVSQKKLIRLFTDEVGFTPKLYLRVTRFQRVLERIAHAPCVDWGDVVERHGYYDQSHFIRDFKEFSGLSPSVYLKRRGPYTQHARLDE
jgi:AraC-like DNA-binding protein